MRTKWLFSAAVACCLFCTVLWAAPAQAAEPKGGPKRVFRIGFLEAGPNWVHGVMMDALRDALRAKGWDKKVEYPEDARKSGAWSARGRATTANLAAELMQRTDLDCIIAMGTEAALALLTANNGRTPIVAMTLSDPVASGVVTSERDSGVDNLTTCVIPDHWLNMVRMFYSVVHFKKLGIMYHDSKAGRTYTNVEDARDVAREEGAVLLEYPGLEGDGETQQCYKGLEKLVAQGMDAFYIPDVPCFDWTVKDPRPLFEYLHKHRVATFARSGLPLVQLGAMMGSCTLNLNSLGEFHARQIMAILQGTAPRKLNMVKADELGLSLNLETAKKIGRDFSPDVLISADVIVSHSIDLDSVRKWY